MALSNIVEKAKEETPELEYKGETFKWSLDGKSIRNAKLQEGVGIGEVLTGLQKAEESGDLEQGIDGLVKIVWMGQKEGLSLDEVASIFTFRELNEHEGELARLVKDILNQIVPEDSEALPKGEESGN